MPDNKKGFTESANSVKPNDESLRNRLEQAKKDLEEGKKTMNQVRDEFGFPLIDDPEYNIYFRKLTS